VLGAFRLDAIIEKSMTYLFPESMDMYLYDTSTSEKKDLLYYLRADKTKDAAMAGETAKIDSGLEYTNMLDLAGLKWLVLYKATPDYIASRATWRPWGILAIGLLLTCALAAYLVSNTRRAQQLQAFTKHLGNAREEERTALSRELHDQVGQSLTAIGINLNIVRSQMNANSPALATARLNESLKLVEEVTGSIRNFMTDLRSPVIDAYGLTAALRWYAEKFSLNTGIAVALHETEPISGLTTETANTLFRITQEALTNVAKHSQATRADIVVASDSGTIRLTISDNGNGFNAGRLQKTDTHGGWGLITMNERATSIQGRCRVVSQPGRGTRIEVEVPLGDY
jgi:signal transduction histidine kinase